MWCETRGQQDNMVLVCCWVGVLSIEGTVSLSDGLSSWLELMRRNQVGVKRHTVDELQVLKFLHNVGEMSKTDSHSPVQLSCLPICHGSKQLGLAVTTKTLTTDLNGISRDDVIWLCDSVPGSTGWRARGVGECAQSAWQHGRCAHKQANSEVGRREGGRAHNRPIPEWETRG